MANFFLLDSVRYNGDVMTILKSDWFNLKTLMSGWYRKLTSWCVSFTIYQYVMAISREMSFQHCYKIRMSTGLWEFYFLANFTSTVEYFSTSISNIEVTNNVALEKVSFALNRTFGLVRCGNGGKYAKFVKFLTYMFWIFWNLKSFF